MLLTRMGEVDQSGLWRENCCGPLLFFAREAIAANHQPVRDCQEKPFPVDIKAETVMLLPVSAFPAGTPVYGDSSYGGHRSTGDD
jgi:hypothetical protein